MRSSRPRPTEVTHKGARATDAQLRYIESLARQAGYSYASAAVKDVLGKNPIGGLSRERASRVIDELKARVEGGR